MSPQPELTVDLPLEVKLAFLRRPESYPEQAYRVEAIETHMSWVFLTEKYAYKLKKPVCHDLLDFRTIEARHFFCEEEVRLNRRLAPRVYLGTVPLIISPQAHLQFGGKGRITDWLVKMTRLPAHRMLDYRIRRGCATNDDALRIGMLLGHFYAGCTPARVAPEAFQQRLEREIEQGAALLLRPAYGLPAERIRRLASAQQEALRRLAGTLRDRVRIGKIVEGHGDLRPEHICLELESEAVVIDCLEFSAELRTVDALDEVGFLALECQRLGAPDFGTLLLQHYEEHAHDNIDPVLLNFYQSFRASVRARLAITHLDEEKFRYSAEWRRRALDYLQLAESHIEASHLPAPSPTGPAATAPAH